MSGGGGGGVGHESVSFAQPAPQVVGTSDEAPGWHLAWPLSGDSHQPQPGSELQAMQLFSSGFRSAQYSGVFASPSGGC